MKHISILIAVFLFAISNTYGQFSQEGTEILKIVRSQDSIPRSIFLDSTLLKNMDVKAMNTRQIWFSMDKTKKHLETLFDIRLKFVNNQAAMEFHRKYLGANSEYGSEIKNHKITYKGANDFKVFNGTKLVNDMVEPYGFKMFCYIFVVDNYFAKIYITCDKSYKPEKFQNLVTDIIKRIKN